MNVNLHEHRLGVSGFEGIVLQFDLLIIMIYFTVHYIHIMYGTPQKE